MSTMINYAEAKAAMSAQGLPVSAGENWTIEDMSSWFYFSAGASYGSEPYDIYGSNYAFVYAVTPEPVANAVGESSEQPSPPEEELTEQPPDEPVVENEQPDSDTSEYSTE